VRAVRVDRTTGHEDLTRSVVTTGEPSWATRNVLLERGLFEEFADDPAGTLAVLHRAMVAAGGDPAMLYALAELSYVYGDGAKRPEYQLAAAVYAWAFLFPGDGVEDFDPFDPRFRSAADLYNWALTAAFESAGGLVRPRGGTYALPFGWMTIAFDPAELRAGTREMYDFVPVAEIQVDGLAMRYRFPGIGAPLAASTRPIEGAGPARDLVAPKLRVPVTALLRVPDARHGLVRGGTLAGTLELHLMWDDDTVEIGGEQVPLETEPTAALALTFTGVPITQLEIFGFLGRLSGMLAKRRPLVSTSPHKPGLIPVVFVHGTASSPVRWAEMFNRLYADPEIRSRYQFWFFSYDSNDPIALSALRLREALTGAVAMLDPAGTDPALRQMVLVGHSQGGLLVKMQVIDSGDVLWNAISRKPLDQLRLSDETRDLIRRAVFVEPLPYVTEVIFVATPQRGSFVAGKQWIANLARRLTVMPLQVARLSLDVAQNRDTFRATTVGTAVDNMSPRQPFIKGLQQIPVAPGVTAHSIIAVDGDGPVETGNDGVVEYQSAHIEPIASELVVRSPHSCQANPHTIEAVRRILLLHAGVEPAPLEPS
jgi:pimeloyl-ACP methyl ester carboxylesterase